MAASVQIHATAGDGQTLRKFSEILQQRMKYMNETARDSVAACALQVLRSLRAATAVAKASKVKPKLQRNNVLELSYTTKGRRRIPCLRIKGSLARYSGEERLVLAAELARGADATWQVYYFEDDFSASKRNKYLVAAPDAATAKAKAKQIMVRRALRYAGLAKRAISVLMMRTFTGAVADAVSPKVTKKAYETTSRSEAVSADSKNGGGAYRLTLSDELRYALLALKGGSGAVDVQMKKALNKIVSTVNRKIPDGYTFFSPQKLDTPFPEVSRRRKK